MDKKKDLRIDDAGLDVHGGVAAFGRPYSPDFMAFSYWSCGKVSGKGMNVITLRCGEVLLATVLERVTKNKNKTTCALRLFVFVVFAFGGSELTTSATPKVTSSRVPPIGLHN